MTSYPMTLVPVTKFGDTIVIWVVFEKIAAMYVDESWTTDSKPTVIALQGCTPLWVNETPQQIADGADKARRRR